MKDFYLIFIISFFGIKSYQCQAGNEFIYEENSSFNIKTLLEEQNYTIVIPVYSCEEKKYILVNDALNAYFLQKKCSAEDACLEKYMVLSNKDLFAFKDHYLQIIRVEPALPQLVVLRKITFEYR